MYVIFVMFFFFLIIVVGLFGNVFIVVIFFCWWEMRILCNLLIVNICVVDLGVCVFVVLLRIIEIYYGWFFGDVLC